RGGVVDVRYGQFAPNVVRVVLTLSGPRHYQVVRGNGAVMVSVDGGGDFVAWRSSGVPAAAVAAVPPKPVQPLGQEIVTPKLTVAPVVEPTVAPVPVSLADYIPQPPQGERRISVTFDKAPIAD